MARRSTGLLQCFTTSPKSPDLREIDRPSKNTPGEPESEGLCRPRARGRRPCVLRPGAVLVCLVNQVAHPRRVAGEDGVEEKPLVHRVDRRFRGRFDGAERLVRLETVHGVPGRLLAVNKLPRDEVGCEEADAICAGDQTIGMRLSFGDRVREALVAEVTHALRFLRVSCVELRVQAHVLSTVWAWALASGPSRAARP